MHSLKHVHSRIHPFHTRRGVVGGRLLGGGVEGGGVVVQGVARQRRQRWGLMGRQRRQRLSTGEEDGRREKRRKEKGDVGAT